MFFLHIDTIIILIFPSIHLLPSIFPSAANMLYSAELQAASNAPASTPRKDAQSGTGSIGSSNDLHDLGRFLLRDLGGVGFCYGVLWVWFS